MKKLWTVLEYYWKLHVICRGDKIVYLRRIGARIGTNCSIYSNVSFGSEPWLIEIGENVTLSMGVVLLTHDGASRLFRARTPGMHPVYGNRFGVVRILENSFVGVNTIVMPGVTIGPNAVVGAGSVVTHDVPPGCVAVGNPAKVLRSLEEYQAQYEQKMLPLKATNRIELRKELTLALWGDER
jgi:acetyltransferase-like isoleucine patch superfamily enzyme